MGTPGGRPVGNWLVEHVLGRFLPRFVSLPLLLVLALFRAVRFERGLAHFRRGGVGLFYWIDTLWLVGTVTLLFTLAFGPGAWRLGILAGLVLFVILHSLIAHAADHFGGYSPAEELMRQSAAAKKESGNPAERPREKGGVGDGNT